MSDPANQTVRYCPECGHIGAIKPPALTCCPDSFGMSMKRWQAQKMERVLDRARGQRRSLMPTVSASVAALDYRAPEANAGEPAARKALAELIQVLDDEPRPFATRRTQWVSRLNSVIEAARSVLATPTGVAADTLHAAILNLPCVVPSYVAGSVEAQVYRNGHRDARHAAAELVVAADESTSPEPQGMRAAFMAWVEDQGCDTDGAWSAWQGCWDFLSAQAADESTRAAPDERFEQVMRLSWQMVDPFKPAGQPGSYARGVDNGISAALKTVRDNWSRLAASPSGERTSAPAPEGCSHHYVRDDERPMYHCCQKCGKVVKEPSHG